MRFALFYEVLRLPACAVDGLVSVPGIASFQRGDDVADVESPAQHVVLLAGAGLDPRHGAAFLGPGFCGIARFGKTAQDSKLTFGAAYPDIVSGGVHEPVEHGGCARTDC